jgi:hypothetical protein
MAFIQNSPPACNSNVRRGEREKRGKGEETGTGMREQKERTVHRYIHCT